jgi:hydroxymethylbilane synthase
VLLDGGVDFVVHSFKDLPSDPVPGLSVVAVPRRADVADVLVTHDGSSLGDLPSGARVGTSSPRRAAGLLRHRPDLEIVPVRGNVDTRVGAISAGRVDAVVLAAAGLQRLGRDEVPAVPIPFDVLLPAPAQGALAIECRTGEDTCDLLAQLDDSRARVEVAAERAILAGVEAQCTTAVGALAVLDETGLTLHAELSDHAGVDYRRLSRTVPGGVDIESAAEIGRQLARDLISPA